MLIALNDNQTAEDFNAGLPPNLCAQVSAYLGPSPAGGVLYTLVRRGREWMLTRLGQTLVMPEMRAYPGPTFGLAPTAGAPHPSCPAHNYTPPSAAPRGASQKIRRPGFIRGVVAGESRPSERPAAHLRAI